MPRTPTKLSRGKRQRTLKPKTKVQTRRRSPRAEAVRDPSAIYFNYGIGAFPTYSFGELTLEDTKLAFSPRGLPSNPPWSVVPLREIAQARARPAGDADRRRAVWVMGALTVPVLGFLGLPWLPSFWKRAGSATLEVVLKPGLFPRSRVFIVENPEAWARAISARLGVATKAKKAA